MHSTEEDATEGNPDECHRAVSGAEERTEDGAEASDVEQLDEKCFPTGHRDVVHAVEECFGGDLGGVADACHAIEVLAVEEVGRHEHNQTDDESSHIVVTIKVIKFNFPTKIVKKSSMALWGCDNLPQR